MGTRAVIRVYEDPKPLKEEQEHESFITIYKHWDGYPSGLGKDIYKNLTTKKTTDMNCLAATLVAGLKIEPGDVRIIPHYGYGDDVEYIYHLCPTFDQQGTRMIVEYYGGDVLFDNDITKFNEFKESGGE
jgi:hypothetical protein